MSRITKPADEPEKDPPTYVRNWEPPTREPDVNPDPDWLRQTLDDLYKKFGVASTPKKSAQRTNAIARCPKCETGNFKHGGVTYCLSCYQRL